MKKLLHLIRYIKLLKSNREKLQKSRVNKNANGIDYDWIYRLYTVLVLPVEDKENIEKYGYYYIDNMVREHINAMNTYLFSLGILEYVTIDTDNVVQEDEFNIRICLRFKFMNLRNWAIFSVILAFLILIGGIASLFIFL